VQGGTLGREGDRSGHGNCYGQVFCFRAARHVQGAPLELLLNRADLGQVDYHPLYRAWNSEESPGAG
jgi:hypothetical protein